MKTLLVVARLPMLEGTATGRYTVGMVRGLRSHGVDVSPVVARYPLAELPGTPIFATPDQIPSDLGAELVPVFAPGMDAKAWARHMLRPRAEASHARFASLVQAQAREADVVHVELPTLFAAREIKTPALVHIHSLVRLDKRMGRPWTVDFRAALQDLATEVIATRRFRFLVANSPVVAAKLKRAAPRATVEVVPLTVEPSYYPRAHLTGPPTAGLIGTAAWPPTARAIDRLVHRVWPLVTRSLPEAQLVLAGRHLSSVRGIAGANIQVVGEVASAPAFLRDLSLLLYPLMGGSGMKVKVLESIASGLPVVTTPDGAEGITSDGVFISETDEELAAATVEILKDDAARHERGAASLHSFERRYAPTPATEPLVALYHRMAV